jgi:hypothetical protein
MPKRPSTTLVAAIVMSLPAAFVVSTVTAGFASADPATTLTNAVDTIRAASQCPPLQPEPLVVRSAQMAVQETSDYISHRVAAIPFTDPMPALKTIGYTGTKGVLLSGYGNNETDSIHGLLLQNTYSKAISDCSYTQYGVGAIQEENGAVITSLVLAGT